ncbi:MAG: hypothetical protein M0T84_17025 [Betaproteobacteria bacterium]|nr:hypothetical protein [Betaproteobacteria bacterium]
MREKMPQVSAFIDDLRKAFGPAEVDSWIRKGLRDGTFRASEGGHVIGADTTEVK